MGKLRLRRSLGEDLRIFNMEGDGSEGGEEHGRVEWRMKEKKS
jgi:hypothetical protein